MVWVFFFFQVIYLFLNYFKSKIHYKNLQITNTQAKKHVLRVRGTVQRRLADINVNLTNDASELINKNCGKFDTGMYFHTYCNWGHEGFSGLGLSTECWWPGTGGFGSTGGTNSPGLPCSLGTLVSTVFSVI